MTFHIVLGLLAMIAVVPAIYYALTYSPPKPRPANAVFDPKRGWITHDDARLQSARQAYIAGEIDVWDFEAEVGRILSRAGTTHAERMQARIERTDRLLHRYGSTPDGLTTEVRVEMEAAWRGKDPGWMPSATERIRLAEVEARRRWPSAFENNLGGDKVIVSDGLDSYDSYAIDYSPYGDEDVPLP